jgi:D-glycero-alpha-D-manno-heptose-7-phosphate kinase
MNMPLAMDSVFKARAPLRLGLGGGGTDVAPYCDRYGGHVLNATIDLYTYASLEWSEDGDVHFHAADFGLHFDAEPQTNFEPDGPLTLHKGVYNRVVRDFCNGRPLPVTLTTFSDAPAGSGLGSSSTMVVCMLRAFAEALNLPLGDYEVAQLAYEIERVDLGLNGGKQDQYAAAFGGFNFVEFFAGNRVIVNPLRIKPWIVSELETSLVLYHTGVSRESANIISEQAANVREGNREAVEAMDDIKRNALVMKESLLKGDLRRFARSLDESWSSKQRMARKISNDEINAVYEGAKSAGAVGGKISGAGGGGYFMFVVEPARRGEVVRYLSSVNGGSVVRFHFVETGAHSWRMAPHQAIVAAAV